MAVFRRRAGVAFGSQLVFILLLSGVMHSTPATAAAEVQTVYATPFITSNISQFRTGIEGASVDAYGKMYATAYISPTSNGLGTIANSDGSVDQEIFYFDQTGSQSFNGIRFLPVSNDLSKNFISRAVATDVLGHQLVHLLQGKIDGRVRGYTFCRNASMAQPNDAAIAPNSGRIYLSGGRYGQLTTQIASGTQVGGGDLWLCQAPSSFLKTTNDELDTVPAQFLGSFGVTNGIEISPDESTLYLSESFHEKGLVAVQRIWKFAINPSTGGVFNQTLFVDFHDLDGSEWVDIDGMRVDSEGNLFVVRNGPASAVGVQKFSPEGELLLRIFLPGIKEATNCELGGPDGTWLFVVGKCLDYPINGCVDVWIGNSAPGRAWVELTR